MRQYELVIRIAQIHHLVDEKKYKKALAVIQTLDVRQVRSLSDLKVLAEVYTRTEQYEEAKQTYLKIYRRSKTRRVLYRLIYLSIRTNVLDEAEAYYQEFVRMNPNARDALILRYRIDKAAGESAEKLIETLQALKQEEYIEEWAYELAKLYHRTGRRDECMEECEDIILWFGTGEIVERAKILIEHLEEPNPEPYYDDKDFTEPKREEPNPEDTGSLPDLQTFIKEQKAQKREERRNIRKMEYAQEEEEETEDIYDDEIEEDVMSQPSSPVVETEEQEPAFIDDYEDGFLQEEAKPSKPFEPSKASGASKASGTSKPSKPDLKQRQRVEYVPHSQSGTGITQDLAKEISAIYEMEHKEQLKEKEVKLIANEPNLAVDVVARMSQALQKSVGKEEIPSDIEEITDTDGDTKEFLPQIEEETKEFSPVGTVVDESYIEKKAEKNEDELLRELLNTEIEDPEETAAQKEIKAEAEDAEKKEGRLNEEMAHYEAPKIPVVETEYMEMPELDYEDLPTTRALHQSFQTVLQLIAGELDPSHFVLLGEGEERVIGVSKQIVKVMKSTGYLSQGRIAKIHSSQLNKMDFVAFRGQLKGNCLLIEGAADLLFPTITKVFAIMEEYAGDFVVILADEGNVLDQLFRFVPVLAKKFKYIIDITKYEKEDYEL